jgi:hypothetical protein
MPRGKARPRFGVGAMWYLQKYMVLSMGALRERDISLL